MSGDKKPVCVNVVSERFQGQLIEYDAVNQRGIVHCHELNGSDFLYFAELNPHLRDPALPGLGSFNAISGQLGLVNDGGPSRVLSPRSGGNRDVTIFHDEVFVDLFLLNDLFT